LEIADMVEEFRAAGCDLDPENIAEEIFANHKEGLSDEPSEDGDFFFYYRAPGAYRRGRQLHHRHEAYDAKHSVKAPAAIQPFGSHFTGFTA
jgi:hypothetical protein